METPPPPSPFLLSAGTHCIDLIQCLPLLVRHAERLGRLNGALHVARPHLQLTDALAPDEFSQGLGVLKGWG